MLAHKVLERTNGRPNDRREFFLGPADKAVEILDQALLRYATPTDDLPETRRLALGSVDIYRSHRTIAARVTTAR